MMRFVKCSLLLALVVLPSCRDDGFNRLTIANLKAAVKGELRSYKKYSDYARKARQEGNKDLGILFDKISGIEKQHALNFMETLEKYGVKMDPFEFVDFGNYPLSSSLENLRYSVKKDDRDIGATYEKYARTAREEKMLDAADAFSRISAMENVNLTLMNNYFISLKPTGRDKKAAIGTTRRVNF